MKKIFRLLAFAFIPAALLSCENETLPVIDNMIYISGADAGRVGTVDMRIKVLDGLAYPWVVNS